MPHVQSILLERLRALQGLQGLERLKGVTHFRLLGYDPRGEEPRKGFLWKRTREELKKGNISVVLRNVLPREMKSLPFGRWTQLKEIILTDLPPLMDLISFESPLPHLSFVSMRDTSQKKVSVQGLHNLPALDSLLLELNMDSLNVRGLASLHHLSITSPSLNALEGLNTLSALTSLDLEKGSFARLEVPLLPSLSFLSVDALESLEVLTLDIGNTSLDTVYLQGLPALEKVIGLESLTHRTELRLQNLRPSSQLESIVAQLVSRGIRVRSIN